MTPMAAECGSSYSIVYLETTSIGMNMTKQLALSQMMYIFIKKLLF